MTPSGTARRLRWLPLAALLALALPAQAAIIPVTSGADDGTGGCTLREAIEAANTDAAVGACPAGDDAADTVVLHVAAVALTAGEIVITEDLVIDRLGTVPAAQITSAFDARLFRVTGGTVTIAGVDLLGGGHTGGSADGAAIRVEGTSAVSVQDLEINGHSAPVSGGAVWVSSTGSFSLANASMNGNTARGTAATDGGGAIYTDGGAVTVTDGTFEDNRALNGSGSGGAIMNPNGATLSVVTSTFTLNRAKRAGGAIETVGGTTTITGTTFDNNIAGPNPGNGGAVHGAGGVALTITDGIAQNNVATGEGGAFWIGGGGTLAVDGTNVRFNVAQGDAADQGGGGIYNDGATLTVSNAAQLVQNAANGDSGSGGAIFANRGSTTITDAAFTRNRSTRAGGAIEALGDFSAPSLVPTVVSVTGSTFDRNRTGGSPGNGGAIHTTPSEVFLTVTGGSFTGNVAEGDGGAIWIGFAATASVDGVTFSDNRTAGSGGAVHNAMGALTLSTSLIDGNRARLSGGGVATVGQPLIVPTRDDLADGGWAQGGLEADGLIGGMTTLLGTTVSNNFADQGGGLSSDFAVLTVGTGSVVSDNEARTLGGGIASFEGALTLAEAAVTDNASREVGGVAAVFGDLTVQRSTVSGNTAERLAGGLGIAQSTFTIDQSLVSDNVAGLDGGGIGAFEGDGLVQNSTVFGNTGRFGGGIYSEGATLSLESATVAGNLAVTGGGLANPDPNNGGDRFVTLANTIVADNSASSKPNLAGRYGSEGYNVIGTTPAPASFAPLASDQIGTDPMLEPLADNGGPTLTAALMAGSPAIDTGMTDLPVDQRGVARTEPDDVGAVEFGDAVTPVDPSDALVITGVIDGPLPGGVPKAIEFYVVGDIADLSAYGVENRFNDSSPSGADFTFPAVAASAGDYLYLASESTEFTNWFGFAPDYTSGSFTINGDDGIILYYDGGTGPAIVDEFGETGVDGTGQAWEYLDGWAYRNDGVPANDGTFVAGNWTYSGTNALDGETSNATASTPFPTGTYSPTPPPPVAGAPAGLEAQPLEGPVALSVVPNPVSGRARATVAVAEAQRLDVRVVDVMGREVARLFEGPVEAQTPVTVGLDAGALAAGVYVVVVRGETVRTTRTVTVAR